MDTVGGPFAVIESDPGVFTSLTRRLGIRGLELIELYDIEPWAVDHLNPHGLIFCFMWRKDAHRPTDFDDPSAEKVWFANQLSDDACATHAILNVVLNCPAVEIGEELSAFRKDTEVMSPVMRGLAITNSPTIRPAHNYLARPADIRASLNNLTITTFEDQKRRAKEKAKKDAENDASKPPPAKRAKTSNKSKGKAKAKAALSSDTEPEKEEEEKPDEDEAYHFIGYVPAYGKVWELDGLKSGPLEVGELPGSNEAASGSSTTTSTKGWMDVVRPALRMKMEKYGGSGNDGSNIRFSLLAIVDDTYGRAHDDLEFLKRERISLEKNMEAGWQQKVDQTLLQSTEYIFTATTTTFSNDFAGRRMSRDMQIMKMSQEEMLEAWANCVQNAMRAKTSVEDEITKAIRSNTDHVKRTFDYEPFIREYIQSLQREGLLNALLDRDDDGKKKRGRRPTAKG